MGKAARKARRESGEVKAPKTPTMVYVSSRDRQQARRQAEKIEQATFEAALALAPTLYRKMTQGR